MMMTSTRADLDLVIGYDVGDDVSYSAITVMARHPDGTLEVLSSEQAPGRTRGQLLNLCLDAIKTHKPRTVSVQANGGKPLTISNQTVEAVLDGTLQWSDLMIGS
jgi:hypothetical protein